MRAILALSLREMSTTYGKSPGGYLWAVLEPVGGIAMLSLVFSITFRSPDIGINFQIFYATGMIPFIAFNALSSRIASTLIFSRALLNYPTVTYVDAFLARVLVNVATQIMVAYVVFGGILLIYETRTDPQPMGIALSLAMTFLLALGVGMMNSFLFAMFPVWQQVWGIVTRPLIIVSGVLFSFGNIPNPYRSYLWWNPLVHVIGQMRKSFYPTYDSSYLSLTYVFALSLILIMGALVMLNRYHRELLQN